MRVSQSENNHAPTNVHVTLNPSLRCCPPRPIPSNATANAPNPAAIHQDSGTLCPNHMLLINATHTDFVPITGVVTETSPRLIAKKRHNCATINSAPVTTGCHHTAESEPTTGSRQNQSGINASAATPLATNVERHTPAPCSAAPFKHNAPTT